MTGSVKWAQDFRYERVHGASHWLQIDAPECVNRLLLDFIRHRDAS
jgi:pimeloyl-ACP methyl ester carboxylesterase